MMSEAMTSQTYGRLTAGWFKLEEGYHLLTRGDLRPLGPESKDVPEPPDQALRP